MGEFQKEAAWEKNENNWTRCGEKLELTEI
jgi:hypothetical protein